MTSIGMQGISLDTTVFASPQQVSCNVADEAVLLSMRDGEYYGLNEVAASIWAFIQQPRTVRDVRDALMYEYEGMSTSECEHAVVGFLEEMLALDLIGFRS